MSKVLARSATILDEADRFEDILNWQLFVADQETKLWGYNPNVAWTPGDPIYPYPEEFCTCGEPYCPLAPTIDGYMGNVTRPMIEEFYEEDDIDFVLCSDCDVTWDLWRTKACWMCGKVVEDFVGGSFAVDEDFTLFSPPPDFIASDFNTMSVVNNSRLEFLYVSPFSDPEMVLVNRGGSVRPMWLALDETQDGPPFTHTYTPSDVVTMRFWMDEWADMHISSFDVETYGPPFCIPDLETVFTKDELTIKESMAVTYLLFDPKQPIRNPYGYDYDIPKNWRELKHDVPMPVMPEPRDWSEWFPEKSYPTRRK